MFNNIFSGKKVLVTGHTGFKGPWLAQWLLQLGADVVGYALKPAYKGSLYEVLNLKSHMHNINADVRDAEKLKKVIAKEKPTFIFHLAAQALVREAYRDPLFNFETNLLGSVYLLDAIRHCPEVETLVFITSDKCYRNVEWEWGYRENDTLGGRDPYSASKACAENIFYSYYHSFLADIDHLRVSTARAGNVIGGGDWAKDRIIPDCMRALTHNKPIEIRNPNSTRPWQHVLEPIGAYLQLAYKLHTEPEIKRPISYNFGPNLSANKTVGTMVKNVIEQWGSGEFVFQQEEKAVHEDMLLQLNCNRAFHYLNWQPIWQFDDCIQQTVQWYKHQHEGQDIKGFTEKQISEYMKLWSKAL